MDRTTRIHHVPRAGLRLSGLVVILQIYCFQAASVVGQPNIKAGSSLPNAFTWEETEPWQRHAIDDTLRGADGVRLADANGDGRLDIVTGWEESGRVRAYFHPGIDSVRDEWPYVDVGMAPSVEDAVWVDLNGDGQLDVLSSCEGKEQTLRVHLAPTSRQDLLDPTAWQSEVIDCSQGVSRWMFAAPLTHSNSRHSNPRWNALGPIASPTEAIAIVVASKNPGGMVGILYRQSMDTRWKLQKLVDAAWVMSLDVVDVDGDGDLDILYDDRKGSESGVYYLENSEPDRLPWDERRWEQHLIGGSKREVMFLDFSIGTKDAANYQGTDFRIVVPVKPNSLLVFSRTNDSEVAANSVAWRTQELQLQPMARFGLAKSVAVGDLNGDGKDDLVFACESAVSPRSGVVWFIRDAEAWKTRSVSGTEGIKFDLLELVDLDADSDLDILTCEERADGRGLGIIWYENPSRP